MRVTCPLLSRSSQAQPDVDDRHLWTLTPHASFMSITSWSYRFCIASDRGRAGRLREGRAFLDERVSSDNRSQRVSAKRLTAAYTCRDVRRHVHGSSPGNPSVVSPVPEPSEDECPPACRRSCRLQGIGPVRRLGNHPMSLRPAGGEVCCHRRECRIPARG